MYFTLKETVAKNLFVHNRKSKIRTICSRKIMAQNLWQCLICQKSWDLFSLIPTIALISRIILSTRKSGLL